jgi:hypothetical protein
MSDRWGSFVGFETWEMGMFSAKSPTRQDLLAEEDVMKKIILLRIIFRRSVRSSTFAGTI